MTLRLRHTARAWRTFTGSVRHLLDDPAIRGVVFNARDVTEQHALETQLRNAQKLEAVGRLAGGIAHDFNNLLALVMIRGRACCRRSLTPADPRCSRFLPIRSSACERGASLSRQLLAFSRRQPLERPCAPIPRRQLVRELERSLLPLVGRTSRSSLPICRDTRIEGASEPARAGADEPRRQCARRDADRLARSELTVDVVRLPR